VTAPTFDINAAIQALREGQDLTGKDGILTPLIKQLTEAALNVEFEGTSPPVPLLTVRTVKHPKPSKVLWLILSYKHQDTDLTPLSPCWLKSTWLS
jgi:hypothetical protein